MTLNFIERIGAEAFLEEARQVHSIREIGRFYGNKLSNEADLTNLLKSLTEASPTHFEVFYYGFYFAAWVKQEVPQTQRRFQTFDTRIKGRIEEGGSLQSLL